MQSILEMTNMLTLVVIWFVCCHKQGTFATNANDSLRFPLKDELHILGENESRYMNRPYLSYVTRVSNRTRSFNLIKNAKTFHRWALYVKVDSHAIYADVIPRARNARSIDTIVTSRSARPDDVILRARTAWYVDTIVTSRSARPDDVILRARTARSVDRMHCQNDEVQCLYSGLCISKLSICDGNDDCIFYKEDEKYCSKTECLDTAFLCNSGDCKSYKSRCNGYDDCWDTSDEVGCNNSTCPQNWFRCNDGGCVEQRRRCDGNNYEISKEILLRLLRGDIRATRDELRERWWSRDADGNYIESDCSDGSDEWNCDNFICPAHHYKCRNGQCVHLSARCDKNTEYRDYFIQDCNDGSDEDDCEKSDCGDYFRCSDGRCLHPSGVCDNKAQCSDAGDETHCHLNDNICPMHTFSCGRGHCVSYVYRCTGKMLAISNNVMNQCHTNGVFPYLYEKDCPLSKCPMGYFRCRTGQCMQYDICNKRDNTYFCDEINDPIDHCGRTDCPRDYFRCQNGHCLHHVSVCDNVTDCAGGEDEAYCGQPECRYDQVNCGDGNCVQNILKCDGYNHCEHGQDEQSCRQYNKYIKNTICDASFPGTDYRDISSCSLRCSGECTCTNGLVNCSSETFMHTGLLGKNDVWPFETITEGYGWPMNLEIPLARIYGLVLSNSLLKMVPIGVLRFTPYVQIFDLSHNVLTHLKSGDFDGLYRLSLLDVSYNRIQTIDDFTFKGLRVLNLHLENNDIQHFGYDLFGGMAVDGIILTDSYRFCCLKPASLPAQHCFPDEADHLTACDNLIRYSHFRVLLWIIGLLAVFGNLGATWRRLFLNRSTNQKLCGFCIMNLHISDLLMGVYLLIIAIADATFRGRYNIEDKRWREGLMCTLGGILSFVWNVSSPMFVLLITVDRYLSTKYPFGEKRVSFRTAVALTAGAWISSIVLAVAPLVFPDYFQDIFYSNSEICLAIPWSTRRTTGWQYETGVYFGIHSLFFSLILTGLITIMREISATKSKTLSSSQISEIRFTKSVMFIVLMNVLCWCSVGIGVFLAMVGADMTREIYSWWMILVLPFKTLLNPCLYMLMIR